MTDDPPAPEPGASLASDDRGVSTTLGYTLTLSITAVLLAGLLTAGGTLIEDQRQAVATDELTVTGQQLAGGFEDADRLAGTTENGTVRMNVWLPDGVGMGGYTLQILNQPTSADQPAQATIVATADGADASRNVSFRTEFPVANRTVPGGPVTIDYRDADGDDERELTVEESRTIGPESAPFDHEEVVFVNDDTGELSSIAPDRTITRYGVDAQAIGPKQVDLDGDGLREVPFVNEANELRLVDEQGETQTLASGAEHSLLAVGEWGGDTDVFYLNESDPDEETGESTVYRVGVDGETEKVTTEDGEVTAEAVAGIGDVDADGEDDLVYVGPSQEIQYVDDGGTIETAEGVDDYSDIDAGAPRGFLDEWSAQVPFVQDGDVKLLSHDGGSTDESPLTDRADDASVAGIDWTDDDTLDVVYIGTDETLRYVSRDGDDSEIESDDEDVEADESVGVA